MIRHAEVAGERHALETSSSEFQPQTGWLARDVERASDQVKAIQDANTAEFICGLPGTLQRMLKGDTVRSQCGPYAIERTNEGGVKLSRAAALIVLAYLMGEKA